MKKRTVALMLCAMMAFGAAGCGAKDADPAATEATESAASTEGVADSTVSGTITSTPCASSAFDLKGSDYVTLCDYSAIPVTITGDYDVDDQKVKDYFINEKIPKEKRNSIPVIEINGKIAAVGRRVDRNFLFKESGIRIEFRSFQEVKI